MGLLWHLNGQNDAVTAGVVAAVRTPLDRAAREPN